MPIYDYLNKKNNIIWKEAQQEVRQHWFIDSYISVCIQKLYRVTVVHPTGLTVNQGCRQVSTIIQNKIMPYMYEPTVHGEALSIFRERTRSLLDTMSDKYEHRSTRAS
jgi:hypothetical protein